uniref:ADGRF3/5-like N-terminal domain-containing protein n=1 Tax=Knipowitschia caucasica TaxID=637954 RepID=A0AAV2K8C0_KNICA
MNSISRSIKGMAISKCGWTLIAVVVIICILQTQKVTQILSLVSPVPIEDEDVLPHTRHKREDPSSLTEYDVDVELNLTDLETVGNLRTLLQNGNFSLTLGPSINLTHIEITTVCSQNGSDFQCRCEDQFVWSYNSCVTYGACDEIVDEACTCLNNIPSDGLYCQPKQDPHETVFEYEIVIEVNTMDLAQLRESLQAITVPVQINSQVNMSKIKMTTVCSPSAAGVHCSCEMGYVWPCDKCEVYGKCENDTSSSCNCINAIPEDGQICQSVQGQNNTQCTIPTPTPETDPHETVFEYEIVIEVNTMDLAQLRESLQAITVPVQINSQVNISEIKMTTVCSPSAAGVHCSCEMGYVWPCDKCEVYGKCENDTTSSCNCINAIPEDGQICQSVKDNTQCTIPTPTPETDFTVCPSTTPVPTSEVTSLKPTTETNVTTLLPVTNTTDNPTTEMNSSATTVPTTAVTTPIFLYRYNIYFEFNTTNSSVMNRLRIVLRNVSSHISANGIHINSVDVSTVCSPNNSSYQCTCEEKYRWPCDLCLTHGSCDNISNDTCGCIHGLPPDGQYCQPLDSTNFTVCPSTTPVPTSEVTSLKPTTETNVTTLLPVTNTTDNPTTEMNSSATTVPTTAVTSK